MYIIYLFFGERFELFSDTFTFYVIVGEVSALLHRAILHQ